MPRNAMRQVQEVSKPLGVSFAVLFDVFPSLCPADHCTHGNDENIHQEMTAIGGAGAAGICQHGKMRLPWKRRCPSQHTTSQPSTHQGMASADSAAGLSVRG